MLHGAMLKVAESFDIALFQKSGMLGVSNLGRLF